MAGKHAIKKIEAEIAALEALGWISEGLDGKEGRKEDLIVTLHTPPNYDETFFLVLQFGDPASGENEWIAEIQNGDGEEVEYDYDSRWRPTPASAIEHHNETYEP